MGQSEIRATQTAIKGSTDWVLANPKPLTFEIRQWEPINSGDTIILPSKTEHKTGILLYYTYTDQEGYYGFFPKDVQVSTRIIPCTNGVDYDTRAQRKSGRHPSPRLSEDGTCTVVGL